MQLLREYLPLECASQAPNRPRDAVAGPVKIPGWLTPAQQKAVADEALAKRRAF
jgi:hypothetical protein